MNIHVEKARLEGSTQIELEHIRLSQKKLELESAFRIRELELTKAGPVENYLAKSFKASPDCDLDNHSTQAEEYKPVESTEQAHRPTHCPENESRKYESGRTYEHFVPAENYLDKGQVIPNYQPNDDVEVYFKAFEKITTIYHWPQAILMAKLRLHLAGKLLEIYTEMEADQGTDYLKFSQLVLEKFGLYAEAYRLKFRNCVKSSGENYKEYIGKLTSLQSKWLSKPGVGETKAQLRSTMAIEQIYAGLGAEERRSF
jgi:hypothetical protein